MDLRLSILFSPVLESTSNKSGGQMPNEWTGAPNSPRQNKRARQGKKSSGSGSRATVVIAWLVLAGGVLLVGTPAAYLAYSFLSHQG